jgi:hypothetical protein
MIRIKKFDSNLIVSHFKKLDEYLDNWLHFGGMTFKINELRV